MDLPQIYGRFYGECEWLIAEINKALHLARTPSIDEAQSRVGVRAQEMALVRTVDSWSRFCRALIIESSCSNPRTFNGTVVPNAPGIGSRIDALNLISNTYKSRPGREPSWHIPKYAIRAAGDLGISNLLTVTAALGSTPNPIDDLRVIRNCIVHRSPKNFHDAGAVINSYGYSGLGLHDFVALHVFPGITMFEKWVLSIRSIAHASIQ